jgi:YgiT-type zinc finger domain-containing protein
MAGRKEKGKIKKCPLCGGELKEGITTIPFLVGEKVAVVKSVPAEICSDCGEAYMKSSVAGKVESILDRLEELGYEVTVVHYEAA